MNDYYGFIVYSYDTFCDRLTPHECHTDVEISLYEIPPLWISGVDAPTWYPSLVPVLERIWRRHIGAPYSIKDFPNFRSDTICL